MAEAAADGGQAAVDAARSQLAAALDSADVDGALAACNALRRTLEDLRQNASASDSDVSESIISDVASISDVFSDGASDCSSVSCASPHTVVFRPVTSFLVTEATLAYRGPPAPPDMSQALVVATRTHASLEFDRVLRGAARAAPAAGARDLLPRDSFCARARPAARALAAAPEAAPESSTRSGDFVSDVGCMKQIFHLASQRGGAKRVSLAVHRVGETLVLDGALDELLDHAAAEDLGDVDPETGEIILLLPKSPRREARQSRLRVIDDEDDSAPRAEYDARAQFLHYSKRRASPAAPTANATPAGRGARSSDDDDECGEDDYVPRVVRTSEAYERVVRWRFDGLETLLGSDTLVFSTGHGDATVHLCEVGQRLTEVAALDLWLENKMTAVENCAICYHKEGHVAGYQIVKTDDIFAQTRPIAEDSGPEGALFDDRCVATLHRARSILDFLQQHCVEDAATYCLTRGAGDAAIQLHRVGGPRVLPDEKGDADDAPPKRSPFDETISTLCLRIARRVSDAGDVARTRRLLDRCVLLCRPNSLRLAEAHERLASSFADSAAASLFEKDALHDFGVGAPPRGWRVALPHADLARRAPGKREYDEAPSDDASTDSSADFSVALDHASRGLSALRRRRRSPATVKLKAGLQALERRARLVLSAAAYRRGLAGDALRFLAAATAASASRVAAADRLRFALVYALMADTVRDDNVDAHRRALHDRRTNAPAAPARRARNDADTEARDDDVSSDDDADGPDARGASQKLLASVASMPVEVSADVEANLSRAIKALIAALHAAESGAVRCAAESLLRVCYTALGERYLSVDRLTKGARHFAEGAELFRSLGDARAESWAQLRLGQARFSLAARQQAETARASAKLEAALETMRAALRDLDAVGAALDAVGAAADADDGPRAGRSHSPPPPLEASPLASPPLPRPVSPSRDVVVGCRVAAFEASVKVANSIVARACLVVASAKMAAAGAYAVSPRRRAGDDDAAVPSELLDAIAHASSADDDGALADAHAKAAAAHARAAGALLAEGGDARLALLLRRAGNALSHFRAALQASDLLHACGETAKAALESLSLRVDAAALLQRVAQHLDAAYAPPAAALGHGTSAPARADDGARAAAARAAVAVLRTSLDLAVGASAALAVVAAAPGSASSLLLPIVLAALVTMVRDLLRALVRGGPQQGAYAALKETYAASLRLAPTNAAATAAFLAHAAAQLRGLLQDVPWPTMDGE